MPLENRKQGNWFIFTGKLFWVEKLLLQALLLLLLLLGFVHCAVASRLLILQETFLNCSHHIRNGAAPLQAKEVWGKGVGDDVAKVCVHTHVVGGSKLMAGQLVESNDVSSHDVGKHEEVRLGHTQVGSHMMVTQPARCHHGYRVNVVLRKSDCALSML